MIDLGITFGQRDALKKCVTWERGLSPELRMGVCLQCANVSTLGGNDTVLPSGIVTDNCTT